MTGTAKYYELPEHSRALREELWRELTDYAARLAPTPLPYIHPILSVEELRRAIGDPPPHFPTAAPVEYVLVATDSQARYWRCFARISPDLRAYGVLVIPHSTVPCPLLLVHHGGGGFPEMPLFQKGNYHDLCDGALAAGYAILLPHYIFQPYFDRDQNSPIPALAREELDESLRASGTSLLAVERAKQQYLLDAVLARPDVDPQRVGTAGLSYGGFFGLYAAALDPRIGVVIVACAFRAHSPQNPAKPSARLTIASSVELAALVCPRPLLVQAGIADTIYRIDNVREAVSRSWELYRVAEKSANFQYVEFAGGHEFHGEPVWDFLTSHWGS
jgi:dienelactone hydrolase